MNLMKKIIILSLSFLICCLSVLALTSKASAPSQDQTVDELTRVRLVIYIFDIDQTQKTVQLQTFVFLDGFPYNKPNVSVLITGAGEAWILCNRTEQTLGGWYYQGESAQATWLLDGIGETFPFDSYILRFDVRYMEYVNTNFTLASTGHHAFFNGTKAYSLNDLWYTNSNLIPTSSISSKELSFSITRSSGTITIYFLEFLAPIIACYYLLGSTLMLDLKKHLSERLWVHVSLFVFVPLFLLAIRDFLPYRSTLSFPEFLLVNLVLSNAIFAIFSIVGRMKAAPVVPQIIRLYRHEPSLSGWDAAGLFLSVLFFVVTYAFTIMRKVNIPASLLLSYLVIPGYICSIPFLITRKQFAERWRRYLFMVLLALLPAIILLIIWLLGK
ncbi:hypothetical protein MUP01_04015 [Candidatus Bathyarchaeota archaeon]|nr:hypothetical protein [Candidatus Bathyarchaeota archaeon]